MISADSDEEDGFSPVERSDKDVQNIYRLRKLRKIFNRKMRIHFDIFSIKTF